jgi:hypothetical protein
VAKWHNQEIRQAKEKGFTGAVKTNAKIPFLE